MLYSIKPLEATSVSCEVKMNMCHHYCWLRMECFVVVVVGDFKDDVDDDDDVF